MIGVLLLATISALPLRIVEPIDTSTASRAELAAMVQQYRTAAIVWRTNAQIERDERERDVIGKQEALRTVALQARLIRELEARERCDSSSLPGWIGIAVGVAGAIVTTVVLVTGG